jgi:hypothetical protein
MCSIYAYKVHVARIQTLIEHCMNFLVGIDAHEWAYNIVGSCRQK